METRFVENYRLASAGSGLVIHDTVDLQFVSLWGVFIYFRSFLYEKGESIFFVLDFYLTHSALAEDLQLFFCIYQLQDSLLLLADCRIARVLRLCY